MIQITLKDGTVKEYENPVSAADVAKDIGMGLYKAACVAKINGEVCDLRTMISDNCELEILTFDDEDGKKTFRHTASHIWHRRSNASTPKRSSQSVRRLKTASIMISTRKRCSRPKCSKKLKRK